MSAGKPKRCRDCPPDARRRPVPHPGPRCATHWRAERERRALAAWDRSIRARYGIGGAEYLAILEVQGGRCFICQRATGATKRLAVDHDHATGEVRGILCGPCNRGVVGHLRDDVDAARRVVEYLVSPPARRVLVRDGAGNGATIDQGAPEGVSGGTGEGAPGNDAQNRNDSGL